MRLVLLAALLFSWETNSMLLKLSSSNPRAESAYATLRIVHDVYKYIKDLFPKLKDEEVCRFISVTLQAGQNPYTVAKAFSEKQLNIQDVDEKTIQESIPSCYADFIINSHKNQRDRIIGAIREQRLISMINSKRLQALSLQTFDIRMMAMYMVKQGYNPYKITNENMQEAIQHLRLAKALFKELNEYVQNNTNSKELEWADQRAMDEIWLLPIIDRLLKSGFRLGMPITDRIIDSLKNGILRPDGPLILKIHRKQMQKLSLYCSNTNYTKLVKEIFPASDDDDIELFIALISSIDLNPVEIARSLHKCTSNISVMNEKTIQIAINPTRYTDFVRYNLRTDADELFVIGTIQEGLLHKISTEIEKIMPNIFHFEAELMAMYIMINNRHPQLNAITDESLEMAQQFTLLICSLYKRLALYVRSVSGSKKRPGALMHKQDLYWILPTVNHLFLNGYRLGIELTEEIIKALENKALAPNSRVIQNLKQAVSLDCF